jgi:anaerobic magnesium-protoporphyrin IX monomethyl ester cyclase
MNIILVGPDHEENLSIRYLSASLLAGGHDTILASFNSPVDTAAVVNAAQEADLVGLSVCFQARAAEFFGLARRIKACDPGKVVVAGGHYASCAAEAILANQPDIDIVAIHEGESTLREIADAMPRLLERLPEIRGIAYRDGHGVRFTSPRPIREDLDALPVPDRRGPVHWIAGVPTSYLMGSRGCYGTCAYCCIATLHRLAPGKRFRERSVDAIADEMSVLYRERGTRQFIFHDDNFLVPSDAMNHARISAFEHALKQRGIRDIALVIKCRPADAKPDVLRRLQELGLIRVFLGVESATERGLLALEREQTVEDSERALEVCSGLGISAQFTLMTFNPGTTLDTLRADVSFMRRFCGNPLNFGPAEIYAGTPLEKQMLECGRAKGDYLARVYRLLDPTADLACSTSLRLFHSRCWSGGSLMQNAIGLDHAAAALKRFYKGLPTAALAGRVDEWVRAVNIDTIDLLDEVIRLSESTGGRANAGFERAIRALAERESLSRGAFLSEARALSVDLQALRLSGRSRQQWTRLARPAAAALLALGIPAASLHRPAVAQSQPVPPTATTRQAEGKCSFVGRVIDPTGAVVPGAKITATNVETGTIHTATTDSGGQYLVNDLVAGHYTVKAEYAGFKAAFRTGIVLKSGACERIDIGLTLAVGSCEYVAVDLAAPRPTADLQLRKKPFTYVVGDATDHGTLRGVAKVVYGDSKAWVQIFEANRDTVKKPESIPYGTLLFIPPRKRVVPRHISKVMPVYPPAAKAEHVWGDVLLDVTLKTDGTVEQASVIDGNPVLADAAVAAVKQWRYRPLFVEGKPVLKFVVAVSFGKGGSVR